MPNPTQTLLIKLTLEGAEIEGAVELPTALSPRRILLPVLHQLTDKIVSIAEERVHASGQKISCKKGCDACCRQMVPIAPAEAHALAALLDTLPPAASARILDRFDSALETLGQKGLLPRLHQRHTLSAGELAQLDHDYFSAQIPCPFLEKKSCSIHPHRPLACREFLVTTPAIDCRNPTAATVTQVPLAAKLSRALAESEPHPWLPLILARPFVADHPEIPAPSTPAQTLQSLLQCL